MHVAYPSSPPRPRPRPLLPPPHPRRAGVGADARGGMLLWGTFAAIFLSGAVFYVHGIAAAIAHREAMQDAADAAAMASAVMHARGMNLIALMNMLMAALLAILVAIKLAESLALFGIAFATGVSFMNPAALVAIPPLNAVRTGAQTAYRVNQPLVHTGIGALNAMSRAIGAAIPASSELRALDAALRHGPPAEVGFVVPTRLSLPTVNGEYDEACGKAGGLAMELALAPFPEVPGVTDLLEDAAEELARGGADWFCKPGQGHSAPRASRQVSRALPELPEVVACRDAAPDDADAACAEAAAVQAAAQPDETTGACQRQCSDAGPYATRAAMARTACDPAARRGLRDFVWQTQAVEHTFESDGRTWRLRDSRVVDGPTLSRGERAPCSPGFGARQTADGAPVCDDVDPPRGKAPEGTLEHVRGHQVLRILGCSERQTISVEVDADDGQPRRRNGNQVPQVLEPGVQLGDEDFQLRAFAIGSLPPDPAAGILALGAPATPGTQPRAQASDPGAHVAVAQAEYYFHDAGGAPDRAEMLWRMRWRARLRRVRMPTTRGDGRGRKRGQAFDANSVRSACQTATGEQQRCRLLRGLMGAMGQLIAH